MSDEHYTTHSQRLDTILGTDLWVKIKSAQQEYKAAGVNIPFMNWIRSTYGVELQLHTTGEFKPNIKIIDEQKYTYFILKFG